MWRENRMATVNPIEIAQYRLDGSASFHLLVTKPALSVNTLDRKFSTRDAKLARAGEIAWDSNTVWEARGTQIDSAVAECRFASKMRAKMRTATPTRDTPFFITLRVRRNDEAIGLMTN